MSRPVEKGKAAIFWTKWVYELESPLAFETDIKVGKFN